MLKCRRITHVRQGFFVLVNKKNKQPNVIEASEAAIRFLGSALDLPHTSVEEFSDTGYKQPNYSTSSRLTFSYAKHPHNLHILLLLLLEPLAGSGLKNVSFQLLLRKVSL